MANQIEQFVPVVQSDGLNTTKNVSITGSLTATGAVSLQPTSTVASIGTSSTGTDVGASVTINAQRGVITTAALTTSAGTVYIVTLKNTFISATSQVFASVYNGSNTGGTPFVGSVTPFAGSANIVISNAGTATLLNGTLKINFFVAS